MIEQVARILVDAGATYASAARAAVLIEMGAPVDSVRPTIEMQETPVAATFDSQLFAAELARVREFTAVLRG